MLIVVTTTWNSATLIETFLRHYRALGVDLVLVMDFDSTDGTDELLRSSEWAGLVRTVPFPGLAGLDSSNLMLDLARDWFGPDTVCLFCDPDELLFLAPESDVLSLLGEADVVVLPRYNMTGLRSVAAAEPDSLSALQGLNLRVDGRCERVPMEDMHKERLVPPWIYTAIPGKVLVRAGGVLSIGDGDHVAVVAPGGHVGTPAPDAYLLHFPMRSYAEFEHKVAMYAQDFAANPQLEIGYGWQAKRWIKVAAAGRLHEEYLEQFVSDDQLAALIEDGTLVRDESVIRHRWATTGLP